MSGVFAISCGVGITLALSGCGGGATTTTTTAAKIVVAECTAVVSGMDPVKCVATAETCLEKLDFCASCPAGDDTENAKTFADAITSAGTAKEGADQTKTTAAGELTVATQQQACYTSKQSECTAPCEVDTAAATCSVYVATLGTVELCASATCALFCGSCPTVQDAANKKHFVDETAAATVKDSDAGTAQATAEGAKNTADQANSCYSTQHTICACPADEHSATIFSTV